MGLCHRGFASDAFRGRFGYLGDKQPTVNVYCFSKAQDPVKDAIQVGSLQTSIFDHVSFSARKRRLTNR